MPRLFVFGTLKRGFPLHDVGLKDAEFLGAYEPVGRYPMVVAGPWFAPMMLDHEGEGLRVKGELYEVPDDVLPSLDELESIGKAGNLRKGGGAQTTALVYMKSSGLARPVHSSFLDEYRDTRFIPPWERGGGAG